MTAGCIRAGWCTAGSKEGKKVSTEIKAVRGESEEKVRPLQGTPEHCRGCKKMLSADEIAMTKKLVNRGTTVYYCTDCLAEMFDVEREDIEEKIAYYKCSGCTLFQ